MRYFTAANLWLLVAVAIFLLRQTERTQPHRVSFLGVGTWFSPAEYNAVAFAVLLIACAFFAVWWLKERRD